MTIVLPPPIADMVARASFAKATAEDVSTIRAIQPLPVPDAYLDLVARFGHLRFDPLDDPCEFEYERVDGPAGDRGASSVKSFITADRIASHYRNLVVEEDDDLPRFPASMLPICSTPGQDLVLLECGEHGGGIWFWEFQGEAWGKGGNTVLGLVAKDLQSFLDGLRVPVD